MHILLKKSIVLYILDNLDEYQLVNSTTKNFRPYIYDDKGNFLIGGDEVSEFITKACDLLSSK